MKEYFLVTCTLHVGFLSMRSPIRDCLDVDATAHIIMQIFMQPICAVLSQTLNMHVTNSHMTKQEWLTF